ncbi:hypothetical protein ACFW1A_13290 [Kitasatospora sp. NPDC058965]|uniref:hypothetical protein n=1 Tax=Kitasatospora sp. NPDC058965 TaxID=3346682 RepID=UPI003674255B
MPPYTHFRMLAYEVPTLAWNPDWNCLVSAWDPGVRSPKVPGIPVPEPAPVPPKETPGGYLSDSEVGLPEDAYIRLLRLANVVELTRQHLVGKPAGVLNVFVVPEFYFRPPQKGRTLYRSDTYPFNSVNPIYQALGSMFSGPAFTDWLFVCGTVLYNNDLASHAPLPGTDGTPLAQVSFFNNAVVAVGGVRDTPFLVEKRVPSHIDGVPEVVYEGGKALPAGPGNNPALKPFYDDWKTRKNHIIRTHGVTVGVEVCLDHAITHAVLREIVHDWAREELVPQAHGGVQLHVLTAGGMHIVPESIAARTNGYILRNDGGDDRPDKASELRRITRWLDLFGHEETGPTPGGHVAAGDDIDATEFIPITQAGRPTIWRPVPHPLQAFVSDQRVAVYPDKPL